MDEEKLQKIEDPETWDLGYTPECVLRLVAEIRRLTRVVEEIRKDCVSCVERAESLTE